MDTIDSQKPTWAGCLLVLIAVAATITACLLFGAQWFSSVVSLLPQENRNDGVDLPDERFLDLPLVKVMLGFVVFGVAILPGLAAYYVGERLFSLLGIDVWKNEGGDEP